MDASSTRHHKQSLQHLDFLLPFKTPVDFTKDLLEGWCKFIEEYSSLDFTKETNTLSALAGIVKMIQSRNGDEFLAGLWKKNLHFYLLWQPTHSGMRTEDDTFAHKWPWAFPPNPGMRIRDNTFAPSWSWASLRGPVKYDLVWGFPLDAIPTAKVSSTIISYTREPLTSPLKTAMLVVSGLLKQMAYAPQSDVQMNHIKAFYLFSGEALENSETPNPSGW